MKKLISVLLLFAMFSNVAFADCDFKTGISPLPDGNYEYTKGCHEQVGIMKKQLDNSTQAIADLNKAISLKDLALKASDDRTQLWMDTSFKLEQREESIADMRKKNDWLYFGLGALTILASGYMASQLIRHN